MIEIDHEKCTGCGTCADECTVYAKSDNKGISVRYSQFCEKCGRCVVVCPAGAISHSELPKEQFIHLADSDVKVDELKNLLLRRRSIRNYLDKEIPENIAEDLIQAGTHAGSASNLQSVGFVLVKDKDILTELALRIVDSCWNRGLKFIKKNNAIFKLFSRIYGPVLSDTVAYYHDLIKVIRKENPEAMTKYLFWGAPLLLIAHDLRGHMLGSANCAVAIRNIESRIIR